MPDAETREDDGPASTIRSLRRELRFLRSIIRSAGDVIVTTDREGRITRFNEGAEAILGYAADEVIGSPARDLYVEPEQRDEPAERALAGETLDDVEVRVRCKDGRKVWLSLTLSPFRDREGSILGTVGVAKDITRRKRLESRLRRLSTTDRLTGLYNQATFFETVEVEKERAVRLGHPLSLVLFDLDGFKAYNDRFGHQAGDEVLREVAGVVFGSIRKEIDRGFRYGGDEFTITTPGADAEKAATFAGRLRRGIEGLEIEGVTASFGVTSYAPEDPRRELVFEADQAMYHSKEAGGNRVTIWSPDIEAAAPLEGEGDTGA